MLEKLKVHSSFSQFLTKMSQTKCSDDEFRASFASLPRNGEELEFLLAFGNQLDDSQDFPKTNSRVIDTVFGSATDLTFQLTERAPGSNIYDLFPPPGSEIFKVELVFSDGTLKGGVFLLEDGSIESAKAPSFARVRSVARSTAFAKLCAQPCVTAFGLLVSAAQQKMGESVLAWQATAYNAFSSILDIMRDPARHCEHVRETRDELCAVHSSGKVTTNLLLEAFKRAAEQPSACFVCSGAAKDVIRHQKSLTEALFPALDCAKAVWGAFFQTFGIGSAFSARYPLLSFSPRGLQERTRDAYDQCAAQCEKKHVEAILCADFVAEPLSEKELFKMCGKSGRAVRLRDVSGPKLAGSVAGHWNDACVSSHVCERVYEPVLSRLLVVATEVDTEAVLAVARDVLDLRAHVESLEADFLRCLRTCCARVSVDMRELHVPTFEALSRSLAGLQSRLPKTAASVTKLQAVVDAAACFDAALNRVLNIERGVRERDCRKEGPRARTVCPHGNQDYLMYTNDGKTKIKRAETQHARFGQSASGRIYCIHPTCVKNRGGKLPQEEGDDCMLQYVAARVAAGDMTDPVHDFLCDEGRCRVCHGSEHFQVTDNGTSISCTECSVTVHVPSTLVERHDDESGCLNPAAGIVTEPATGSMTCLGCGVVLSDYTCIDSGPDERVFLDDEGAEDPTHHCAAASPFLTNGSNVTFISKPRPTKAATERDVRDCKKIVYIHNKMNRYVCADDMMRLTTWVKRDGHIKALHRVIYDVSRTDSLRLTKQSQDFILSRFRDIRWSSEKIYSIRLLVFVLVVCEVARARERAEQFNPVPLSTCTACGVTLSFREVQAHLIRCRSSMKDTMKKKESQALRRKTYNKFSENVLFA